MKDSYNSKSAGKEPLGHEDSQDQGSGFIEDGELLQRHVEGDPQAFTALVGRYRRELYNFLFRFTGDAALAEDIFQETFLQIHISAATFDQTRRLKPWLFTIAANKARDAMRRGARRQTVPLDAAIDSSGESVSSYAEILPADIPQPAETLMNLETRRAVQNIVRDMPENMRTVLLLNYFHGFPYKEIAEMLSVPLGTVKSRLHAAINYFARKWKIISEQAGHDEPEKQ